LLCKKKPENMKNGMSKGTASSVGPEFDELVREIN